MRKIIVGVAGLLIVALAIFAGMRTLGTRQPGTAPGAAADARTTTAAPQAAASPIVPGQPTTGAATDASSAGAANSAAGAEMPGGQPIAPGALPGAGQSSGLPAAAPPPAPIHWMNIADATLGGHVERVTSVAEQREVTAANLIDNGVSDPVCAPFCAWSAKDTTLPQDLVLSFYKGREANVARVVIDTLTSITRSLSAGLPHQVEVAVSTASPTDGFTTVATVELPAEWAQQPIDFPPHPARYLRVRILSSYGGKAAAVVGEIRVFESDASPSILADFPPNLALPALGGAVASFTSDYATYTVSRLTDGDRKTDWRSADITFPQDFVFGFRDDAVALVDRLILSPANPTTSPKVVAVSTSLDSPIAGFEQVGTFTLKPGPSDQTVSIGRRARFVKLRIIENGGSTIYTSLGEVRILEGAASGYQPVLARAAGAAPAEGASSESAGSAIDPSTPAEQEKNDEIAQANRLELGHPIRGGIDPIGESDYFSISVPGPSRPVVTIDLSARPNIRTSLNLVAASGAPVKRFDPAHVPADHATFSWLVDPGDYAIQLTQPRSSVVLIWDTSGSMVRNVADLQHAVETYLDQVSPAEVVNLIRFSYDIEVLLPDFTNDRAKLKKAAQGRFFADGHTPFYDVMAKAASLLEGRAGNRAIVVMTDGEDAGSSIHEPDFWRGLPVQGIRVYTIGIGDAGRYSARLGSTPRQLLRHISMATNGRAFFADTGADLVRVYQQISQELGARCTYRLNVTAAAATGTMAVKATGERIASVAAPAQLELILDASGSMKRAIGGRRMIDTAKAVLSDIVRGLPDDMHVALRVYGHHLAEGRPGACQDSELVYPFAALDKSRLLSRIHSVQALGTTPIAYSLQQVARDMSQPGEKMVVLVTDGKEECGGDPTAVVKQLVASGVKLKLNIVGFALADASLKAELGRLADLTKGQFVDAKDSGALRSGIEQSFAVPYDVLDASGAVVAQGTTGQAPIRVPEGVYTVRVNAEKPIDVEQVRVSADQPTVIELKKEGREIAVHVTPAARPGGE